MIGGSSKFVEVVERIEHTVKELVAQRVNRLALEYEGWDDHDELRQDPLLAVLAGKEHLTGESRGRDRDQGKVPVGKGIDAGDGAKGVDGAGRGYPCAELLARIWAQLQQVPRRS